MPTPEGLLQAALLFGKSGIPVLPLHQVLGDGSCSCRKADCKSFGKHPLTAHGLLDATTDAEQIRRWWGANPTANVGLRTGPEAGIFVIDVDPRHGGLETWLAIVAEHGEPPITKEAITGGGGNHLFFRYPTGRRIASGANVLGAGVDIRGEGGYVVAPPSNHQAGSDYRWDGDSIMRPVAEAPEWLIEAISAGHAAERLDMARTLMGVPEGSRDVDLFRAASKLRYAGVPYELTLALIIEAGAKCTPPFEVRDATAKVQSAYSRYVPQTTEEVAGDQVETLEWNHIRVTTTTVLGPVAIDFDEMERGSRELSAELTVRLLLPGTDPEPYRQSLNILSQSSRDAMRRDLDAIFGKEAKWTAILSRAFVKAQDAFAAVDRAVALADIGAPTQVPYIVDGLCPATGPTILFGAAASTKTYLAFSISAAIASGTPWLGRRTEKRNVLYIDYETGASIFGYRLNRLLEPGAEKPPVFYWDAQGVPLGDQIAPLRQTIARHNIGYLIIDHAAAACGGEPERAGSALAVQRALDKLGVPSLLIAHITGAGELNPAQVLRPFGSYFFQALARETWYIQRLQGAESDKAEVGFYSRKATDSARRSDFGVNVFFGEVGGPVRVTPADIRLNSTLNASRGAEWAIWEVLLHPMTVSEIASATSLNEATIKARLNEYRGMFHVEEAGGGRGHPTIWGRLEDRPSPIPF